MGYKAVIFDLDGTLIDSMTVWEDIGKRFLAECKVTPPENLNQVIKTMSFEQSAQYFIDTFGLKFTREEILSRFHKMVEDQYRNFIELKPYVKKFLNRLKRKGIEMCIATATDRILTEQVLNRLGILSYFAFIITVGEIGQGKDNPKIYLKAAEKLGNLPKDIVVFEDALHPVKIAKNAGFHVVGVYDPSAKEDFEEIKQISDYAIYSFQEIEKWF